MNLTRLTGSVFSRERHVPMRFSTGGRKLPWLTGDLSCLKKKGHEIESKRKTMSRGRND
jgi:hypothetical protein